MHWQQYRIYQGWPQGSLRAACVSRRLLLNQSHSGSSDAQKNAGQQRFKRFCIEKRLMTNYRCMHRNMKFGISNLYFTVLKHGSLLSCLPHCALAVRLAEQPCHMFCTAGMERESGIRQEVTFSCGKRETDRIEMFITIFTKACTWVYRQYQSELLNCILQFKTCFSVILQCSLRFPKWLLP